MEEITLGLDAEGVTLPVEDFRGILKFSKLKYLYLAIHGLQNEHFRILSEHPGLIALSVRFGPAHQLMGETMIPVGNRILAAANQSVGKVVISGKQIGFASGCPEIANSPPVARRSAAVS